MIKGLFCFCDSIFSTTIAMDNINDICKKHAIQELHTYQFLNHQYTYHEATRVEDGLRHEH